MEVIMSNNTIGDILQSKSKEVDHFVAEISILNQLIKESANRFDLVRELLSNSGSKQVVIKNRVLMGTYTIFKDTIVLSFYDGERYAGFFTNGTLSFTANAGYSYDKNIEFYCVL
jgi:hypothetical protein